MQFLGTERGNANSEPFICFSYRHSEREKGGEVVSFKHQESIIPFPLKRVSCVLQFVAKKCLKRAYDFNPV